MEVLDSVTVPGMANRASPIRSVVASESTSREPNEHVSCRKSFTCGNVSRVLISPLCLRRTTHAGPALGVSLTPVEKILLDTIKVWCTQP